MKKKYATTEYPIDPRLAQRWSPRSFDTRMIDRQDLHSLFEAARWSPSANNLQPWAFVYTIRRTSAFAELVECLNETNAVWAQKASALVIACAASSKPDGSPHKHAAYDLGQSVAHLSFQAGILGMHVHQMGGFDAEKVRDAFSIPITHDPLTVIAAGYLGGPTNLPANLLERELAPRSRHQISQFVFESVWGS